MRSLFATLQALTLPAGAPPGTPRIVIGGPLPPPLDTYVAANANGPYSYVSGIIFYGAGDDTTYTYLCTTSKSSLTATYVHMGHVVSGVVQVDPLGFEQVQSWQTGTAHVIEHKFIGTNFGVDLSHAQVLISGNVVGGIGFASFGVADNGIVSVSSGIGGTTQIDSGAGGVTLLTGSSIVRLKAAAAGRLEFDIRPRVGAAGTTQQASIPYGHSVDACNATTTVTGTTAGTATPLPNMVHTVPVQEPGDVFWVEATLDVVGLVAAPASVLNGVLKVDGGAQTANVTFKGPNTARGTCPQHWLVGGLAAGNHTFAMSAFSATASEYAVAATNSVMAIEGRYRGP